MRPKIFLINLIKAIDNKLSVYCYFAVKRRMQVTLLQLIIDNIFRRFGTKPGLLKLGMSNILSSTKFILFSLIQVNIGFM